ncbi:MAG: dockerin type I domain-containing protein [Bacteroidales bacterium]|nr:dockerin type I domain-containing protein [Bacteroidales bacterium]
MATRATISGMLGDVNGDGIVSSVDVTALYNYLLNNDSSAIVNGD